MVTGRRRDASSYGQGADGPGAATGAQDDGCGACQEIGGRRAYSAPLRRDLAGDGGTGRGGAGRYGAYSLRRGSKTPPLMFTDEEALGLSLGLLAARQPGLSGGAPAIEGLWRRSSGNARRLARASEGIEADRHPIDDTARDPAGQQGGLGSRRRGRPETAGPIALPVREETVRVVDPYALLQRKGRWHLFGHCHLREGLRLFRLDGMLEADVLKMPSGARPNWTPQGRCFGLWRTRTGGGR